MITLNVTPDEYWRLRDAIDRATSLAMLFASDAPPVVDLHPIVDSLFGNTVAKQLYGCVQVAVHWDGIVTERVS